MVKQSVRQYSPIILILISISLLFLAIWLIFSNKIFILEWEIVSIMLTPVRFTIILDIKGVLFSSAVLFISSNVLYFSKLYIMSDKFIDRFTILVLLFVLSINLLIYIPNIIILLLGWDGLGLVSFVLVIYYQNSKSLAAGIITAITNRIGDVIILLSIGITLNQGHWNVISIWDNYEYFYPQVIIITIAAITKRAQIPFRSWLPAAIAAPTPVSALVHSSTLVTAGVFLLIRFYPFLSSIPGFNRFLLYVAIITITIAGLSATAECDIKKIIALSTLRQLGLIISSLGLNLPLLTYFHIVVHAIFKALLFICAGVLIHNHMHSQDLRWIGNLVNQIPITASCIIIANLAMGGFPFLSAFYTKDIIIELSLLRFNSSIILILLYISLGVTAFYRLRFSIFVLWIPLNSTPFYTLEEPKHVRFSIIILCLPSVIAGILLWWIYPFADYSINFSPIILKLPLVIISIGIIIAWVWSKIRIPFTLTTQLFLNYIWYLTPISTQYFIGYYITASKFYLEFVDQSWLEHIGRLGLHNEIILYSNINLNVNKANLLRYITLSFLILGTLTIFIFYLSRLN